ncbi:FadR/GntR family transcriptional regulator [Micromonospora sp. NPDC048930]|uniref:FadR/GntR family transcriptional regulator n=1 Tax=Micromonospora sp. NPDC048930 TaxID=3364261 RepID=UPI003723CAAE
MATQLEGLIRKGHCDEGGRLPSERELVDRFGVGRGNLREAVRNLETLGTVVQNQGVGTFAVIRRALRRSGRRSSWPATSLP